jgi:DNA-binding response OmpR family regulator
MRQSPKVVTKQELMMELWGDEEPESDALRSHIYNLRKMVDKPFDFNELVMRIRALIKRAAGEVTHHKIQIHDLILDSATQTVVRAGNNIELPPIQFKLLKILMRQSPKVVTKQELMMELWGDEEPESDALRSHIYNLRKMVDKPFDPKLLHTVAGVGLKIALEDSAT